MVDGVRVPVRWTAERAAGVLTCSFSPDGSQVLCGGRDKKLSLLDAVTGKEVWTVERAGNVLTCAFSPDGSQVLCGGNDKKLSLLRPGLTSPCGAFSIKDFITSTFAKLVDILFPKKFVKKQRRVSKKVFLKTRFFAVIAISLRTLKDPPSLSFSTRLTLSVFALLALWRSSWTSFQRCVCKLTQTGERPSTLL